MIAHRDPVGPRRNGRPPDELGKALLHAILTKAHFLAINALNLHEMSAEMERGSVVKGMELHGAPLCATYLEIAEELQGMIHEYRKLARAGR